jgi:hypothetical protein
LHRRAERGCAWTRPSRRRRPPEGRLLDGLELLGQRIRLGSVRLAAYAVADPRRQPRGHYPAVEAAAASGSAHRATGRVSLGKGHKDSFFNKRADKLAKASAKSPALREPLDARKIRRKTTSEKLQRGSVEMLGQQITIRRACWVTQAPVGLGEQPASQTRRFACATKNKT